MWWLAPCHLHPASWPCIYPLYQLVCPCLPACLPACLAPRLCACALQVERIRTLSQCASQLAAAHDKEGARQLAARMTDELFALPLDEALPVLRAFGHYLRWAMCMCVCGLAVEVAVKGAGRRVQRMALLGWPARGWGVGCMLACLAMGGSSRVSEQAAARCGPETLAVLRGRWV